MPPKGKTTPRNGKVPASGPPAARPEPSYLEQVCECFEAALQENRDPKIERFLGDAVEPERTKLFRRLLRLELEYRQKRGERPRPQDYLPRFPDFSSAIDSSFEQPPSTVSYHPPAAPEPGAGEDAGRMEVTLTVVKGPHQGKVFTFREHSNFIVGRSRSSHFRLPIKDKSISRTHFLVEVNPPRCRLMDMASLNGTFVNGCKVLTADLEDGDLIQAGQSAIVVTIQGKGISPIPAPREQPDTTTFNPQGRGRFAGYFLEKKLGRGGMGVVYRARRVADGSLVALKTIRPKHAGSPAAVERFLQEASILRRLSHPNIVAFREIGAAGDEFFFVMELVSGTDAGNLLKQNRGPLPVARAVRLLCQILEALEYAHKKKLVHRDIKPRNVLVTPEGDTELAKLADFGLARLYQTSSMSGMTLTGNMGGTIGFMAPEQITRFHDAQAPADQYGAMATLYYLLTCKRIYDFPERMEEKLAMVLEQDPVPIRRRRPDIPLGLAVVIEQALARDPRERFPDVGALRAALQPFTEWREEPLADEKTHGP